MMFAIVAMKSGVKSSGDFYKSSRRAKRAITSG
jgi:hypothetical protein